ncbi:hypothetical protein, partial [Pectobacterium sp. HCp5_1]|uniref:hypothetical protein n=1 Tax=Pectobacterium sp. HCp5_1 TaxID=3062446 RepID=UPI00293C1022
GLFAHKTGILPQPLPSGSSSKYLGKQMNILPDDHRVEYVTVFSPNDEYPVAGFYANDVILTSQLAHMP